MRHLPLDTRLVHTIKNTHNFEHREKLHRRFHQRFKYASDEVSNFLRLNRKAIKNLHIVCSQKLIKRFLVILGGGKRVKKLHAYLRLTFSYTYLKSDYSGEFYLFHNEQSNLDPIFIGP